VSNAPSEFRYDVCLSFAGKDPMPQGSRCNLVRRVKTNTFVTDFDEFQKCGDVRMRYFGVATLTSTTVDAPSRSRFHHRDRSGCRRQFVNANSTQRETVSHRPGLAGADVR